MRSFRSLHQLLALSLWRCRSRRACVRACAHSHVRVCGRVCIHMRRRACVRVHTYARAPVYAYMRTRMHVHACAHVCAEEGPGGGVSACLAVSWARVSTYVHVHACARVYAWARMCTACSECYMHFGTGVLGTSAWQGVYVTQVCFYTNVHICDTLTAGCAHVCVCIYVCIWMRVCMDTCMRL